MAKNKQERTKRKLLRRVRRQRLKYVTILPSLITLINGLCGFASIGFASKGVMFFMEKPALTYLSMSGYMIFVAMIADMLDGRVARMSQSTSSFGGQLDSLCDMISFGVAPAFLVLKVLRFQLSRAAGLEPAFMGFLERFIWLTAGVYVACAAIRLARFNVENEEDETAHMVFVGLPTPAAAGVLASLVVFYEDLLPNVVKQTSWSYQLGETAILYTLPFISLGIAILMISRIRYPHVINQYLRGRKPFSYLFWMLALIGLVIWNLQAALTIIFCGFALSGFTKWCYYRFIIKKNPHLEGREPPVLRVATSSKGENTE